MFELNDDLVNPVKKTINEIKLPQNLTTFSICKIKFIQKLVKVVINEINFFSKIFLTVCEIKILGNFLPLRYIVFGSF